VLHVACGGDLAALPRAQSDANYRRVRIVDESEHTDLVIATRSEYAIDKCNNEHTVCIGEKRDRIKAYCEILISVLIVIVSATPTCIHSSPRPAYPAVRSLSCERDRSSEPRPERTRQDTTKTGDEADRDHTCRDGTRSTVHGS